MKTMFAAIHHPMSAEDPESALDVLVQWISPFRQKLVDACVAELAEAWEAVRVETVDGNEYVQAGDGGSFSTYYVVQAASMLV